MRYHYSEDWNNRTSEINIEISKNHNGTKKGKSDILQVIYNIWF